MPVFNGSKYLKYSIESILNQSYDNFEFIIVDDFSNDESIKIIKSYNDKRIKLIKNKFNLGQAPSMNIGLDNCSGKYVARIDQDDISLSKRLERQVEFMENNDDIGVCGTWIEYIGKKSGLLKLATDYRIIKIKLLRDTELAHPTVMIRKSILNKYGLKYDPTFSPAEDYHLWTRLSKYCKLGNIGEVLSKYRIHNSQGSDQPDITNLIQKNSDKVRIELIRDLGIEPSIEEIKIHNAVFFSKDIKNLYLKEYHNWIIRLISGNKNYKIYDHEHFVKILKDHWCEIVDQISDINFRMVLILFFSPLRESVSSFKGFFNLFRKFFRKWIVISKVS